MLCNFFAVPILFLFVCVLRVINVQEVALAEATTVVLAATWSRARELERVTFLIARPPLLRLAYITRLYSTG